MELAARMGRGEESLSPSRLWMAADSEASDPEQRGQLYGHAAYHAGMYESTDGKTDCPRCGESLAQVKPCT